VRDHNTFLVVYDAREMYNNAGRVRRNIAATFAAAGAYIRSFLPAALPAAQRAGI